MFVANVKYIHKNKKLPKRPNVFVLAGYDNIQSLNLKQKLLLTGYWKLFDKENEKWFCLKKRVKNASGY